MSPVSRIHARPPLGQLAEFGHATALEHDAPSLLLYQYGSDSVSIGQWSIPERVAHPADPLVGYLADPTVDAIGLGTRGRLSDGSPRSTRVWVTVTLDRSGSTVSILEQEGRPRQIIEEPVLGWVADAMRRTLALPTAAPTDRIAHWVETAWLDNIATRVLGDPGGLRTWRALAELHPLVLSGPTLPPALVAVEAEAIDLESSWARLRHLVGRGAADLAHQVTTPPQGTRTGLEHWFDDGSFSRWVQRNQPPAQAILPAVLDALPSNLGTQLLDALVTIALE